MTRLQHASKDTALRELGERAIRHAATTFMPLMGCRRRACRRNGCCGPMGGEHGCLALPDGRRIDGIPVPACMIGIDPHIVSHIEEQACAFLELLLYDPGYNLHPARFLRTFGKAAGEDAFAARGGRDHG